MTWSVRITVWKFKYQPSQNYFSLYNDYLSSIRMNRSQRNGKCTLRPGKLSTKKGNNFRPSSWIPKKRHKGWFFGKTRSTRLVSLCDVSFVCSICYRHLSTRHRNNWDRQRNRQQISYLQQTLDLNPLLSTRTVGRVNIETNDWLSGRRGELSNDCQVWEFRVKT